MALLSLAWHALDDEGFAAWRALASASAVRNPATGAWVTPNPYNLFCKYAGKVRQVDPGASLAGFRPAGSPFGGDGVSVECGVASGERGTGHSALQAPPSPLLLFSSSGANAEGVVTELLTQPLVNARRRVYPDRYVSRGFVAFEGGSAEEDGAKAVMSRSSGAVLQVEGTAEVPCAAGAWACAYRFVRAATGQETALFELGVVEVAA